MEYHLEQYVIKLGEDDSIKDVFIAGNKWESPDATSFNLVKALMQRILELEDVLRDEN